MMENCDGKNQDCTQLTGEERELARMLDHAMEHPEMAPQREASPDEWPTILSSLEKSGALSRLRQELNHKNNSSDLP